VSECRLIGSLANPRLLEVWVDGALRDDVVAVIVSVQSDRKTHVVLGLRGGGAELHDLAEGSAAGTCAECGGSGKWTSPMSGRVSPCRSCAP